MSWNIIEKTHLATRELEPESPVSVDRNAMFSTITHPQERMHVIPISVARQAAWGRAELARCFMFSVIPISVARQAAWGRAELARCFMLVLFLSVWPDKQRGAGQSWRGVLC